MAALGAATLGGIGAWAADIAATAGMYSGYAAGAGQLAAGGALLGAAGAAPYLTALGGTTVGKGAMAGLGSAGGRSLWNWISGGKKNNKPAPPGGCTCQTGTQKKPQLSCEQKCQYGRLMAQKCTGCKGYSPKKGCGSKKTGYKKTTASTYVPYYKSSSGYGASNVPYGGAKPKRTGRAYRKNYRTTARQDRRSARQEARQTRRANRQTRRANRRN